MMLGCLIVHQEPVVNGLVVRSDTIARGSNALADEEICGGGTKTVTIEAGSSHPV